MQEQSRCSLERCLRLSTPERSDAALQVERYSRSIVLRSSHPCADCILAETRLPFRWRGFERVVRRLHKKSFYSSLSISRSEAAINKTRFAALIHPGTLTYSPFLRQLKRGTLAV